MQQFHDFASPIAHVRLDHIEMGQMTAVRLARCAFDHVRAVFGTPQRFDALRIGQFAFVERAEEVGAAQRDFGRAPDVVEAHENVFDLGGGGTGFWRETGVRTEG